MRFRCRATAAYGANGDSVEQIGIGFGTSPHAGNPGIRVTPAGAYVNDNPIWHSGNAAKSWGQNGYQKLPNGLIIQWGISEAIGIDSQVTVNFPIPFPNACFIVVAVKYNPPQTSDDDNFCVVRGWTLSSATFWMEHTAGGGQSGARYAAYIAIGW